MHSRWFSRKLPTSHSLRQSRLLKPFSRHLHQHFLWQFNRRRVALGVAIGLFFGILVPFLQIFLAAIAAIVLRANLPVAAFSTLVTNPLTFPPIYYLAYRLGELLTGSSPVMPETRIEADIEHAVAVRQGDAEGWLPNLVDWVQSVGLPLATGLFVLATAAAIAGYFLVAVLWNLRIRFRWHRHRQDTRRD